MQAIALTIAGSDPSGGAGIQADLKTFHQFGVYGEAVITLLTVQNTQAVSRIEVLSPELVQRQIEAVVEDIPPNAAKTGALGTSEMVECVAALARTFSFPLVVDPVMIGKHGSRLLSTDAESALKKLLIPRAALLTPNIPEAESLTGTPITTVDGMFEAAKQLLDFGCGAVLLKGGHLTGEPIDLLCDGDGTVRMEGRRIHTVHTHGTGCTYAAAITAALASGSSLREAVFIAKGYLQTAIETAPGLGKGQGPVNHFAPTGG